MARIKPCIADDVVLDILDRVSVKTGSLPKKVASEIERGVRQDWGGEVHYIAKQGESARVERLARDERIRADHRRGESNALLSRRYHISERRVQQIVSSGAKDA